MNINVNYKKMSIGLKKKNEVYTLEIEYKKKAYEFIGDKKEVMKRVSKYFGKDKIAYIDTLIKKIDAL